MSEHAGVRWLARVFGPADQVRAPDGALWYTVSEVKQALRQPATDPRTRRVHDCLARLGAVVDDLEVRRRFRGLEDYHRRLLRILTLYCRGWEVDTIAADLSLFSTGIGVERAIDVAASILTDHLNRHLAA
jgi:hypothetical protein